MCRNIFVKADRNSLGGYCEAIYNSRLLSGSVISIFSSSILLLAAKFFLKCLKQDFRDKISKLTRASLINGRQSPTVASFKLDYILPISISTALVVAMLFEAP